jgi:hypothetical protein
MGERVVVGVPPEPPKPVEPLNYAEPSTGSIWDERVKGVVRLVGGPRQIFFAAGLACVGAGLGGLFDRSGDTGAWLLFGGLFLGLAIPAPRWRS